MTMSSPSGPTTAALRKLESKAVSGDVITRQSSASSNRLAATEATQKAPIPQASRVAFLSLTKRLLRAGMRRRVSDDP